MQRITGIFTAIILCCPMLLPQGVQAVEVSARACILMEADSGRVLYEQHAREQLPMASTTKIMTTLLCIESGNLDAEFAVDNAAIHVEGSSMGLCENDIVTKYALCCGMLLPSGNDAANAAAAAVAGSIPAFVERMNERAAQIGMQDTHFVTPSGLDGDGHGASAYDMALLTREAMRNPVFREICAKKSACVNFGNPPYARTLYNTNKLLGMYEGVIGVKTGFTDAAGRCLVSACERDGVTLYCVTLHAPNDWQDHQKLYDYGFAHVRNTALPIPEGISQKVVGSQAQEIPLVPQEEISIGAWEGDVSAVTYTIRKAPFAYAPIRVGDALGELVYYYENVCIGTVPLCAAQDAQEIEERAFRSPLQQLWDWVKHLF